MKNCLFCKIVSGEIKTSLIYQDDLVVAFNDINPLAPVHILVISRRHITSMNDVDVDDEPLLGRILFVASKLARKCSIADGGYKLLLRTGKNGGQEVPHIHLHLIGGAPMIENICPENK